MIAIIAILAITFAVVCWQINRRIFNPGTIFVGTLGLQLGLYGVMEGTLYQPLSSTSLIAAASGLIGFAIGYSVVLLLVHPVLPHSRMRRFSNIGERQARRLFRIAASSALIACVWHAAVGMGNIKDGTTGIALLDLRLIHLANPGRFMLAPHLSILAQFLFLYLYLRDYRSRTALACMIGVSIFCAFWKMERSAILMAIYAAMVAIEFRHKRLSVSTITAGLLSVTAIFVAVALLRDSHESSNDALAMLMDYFARNLQTFDLYVVGNLQTWDWTLLLGKYLTVFGVEGADSGTGVDQNFNTYSYLKPLYQFGGKWFPLPFGLAIGVIFGWMFNWLAQRGPRSATLFCFLSFSLFISFFEYTFNWTNWAYYILAALLIPILCRGFPVRVFRFTRVNGVSDAPLEQMSNNPGSLKSKLDHSTGRNFA